MEINRRSITELKYRLKIRKTLKIASLEELTITKEEINKELERRNKKK